ASCTIMNYRRPPGSAIPESNRILREVEQELDRTPEIVAWSRRTGDQLGFFITEPNQGDYVLQLKHGKRRSADEVSDDLRQKFAVSHPEMELEFGQLVADVIGDLTTNPEPTEVRGVGEDRNADESKAAEVQRLLSRVKGVVDVRSGAVVSGPK